MLVNAEYDDQALLTTRPAGRGVSGSSKRELAALGLVVVAGQVLVSGDDDALDCDVVGAGV